MKNDEETRPNLKSNRCFPSKSESCYPCSSNLRNIRFEFSLFFLKHGPLSDNQLALGGPRQGESRICPGLTCTHAHSSLLQLPLFYVALSNHENETHPYRSRK